MFPAFRAKISTAIFEKFQSRGDSHRARNPAMMRSPVLDEGFGPSTRSVSSRLTDAATAAVAVLFLTAGLIVALTALSIRIAAAMQVI
jgi:hypothetical protein